MRRYDRPTQLREVDRLRMPITEGDFAALVFHSCDAPWVTIWRVEPGKIGLRLPDPPDDLGDVIREAARMGMLVQIEAATEEVGS